MENVSTDFLESNAGSATLETQQEYFSEHTANSPAPEGEEDDDTEKEDEDQGGNSGNGSDDDNPSLDQDVVHSPVDTQSGGKPGGKSK